VRPIGASSAGNRIPHGRGSSFLINALLLALAVLFFALAHPNPLFLRGLPFIAYFAFIPLFLLVRRASFGSLFLWGGFYGLFSYSLFGFWLASFHPLALYFLAGLYFFVFLAVFPLLKLADVLFPKYGYVVQWLLWLGFEYLKTLGFSGYSYGIIGYSQWSYPVIIRIAAIFGVWGVSALVVFPSAWVAGALKDRCGGPLRTWLDGVRPFTRAHALSLGLWVLAFLATIGYGLLSPQSYKTNRSLTVALIQPNSDPWVGGMNTYRGNFTTLTRLSDEALARHPEVDLIVWPETAFIPRIDWHYRYREDPDAFELVSDLLTWINRSPVPVLTGNDDAEMGVDEEGSPDRVDYNAALLFDPGKNVIPPKPDRYRKMHLVPFTEYFPFRDQAPVIYNLLLENDTHFWAQGDKPVVFSCKGLSFSTPICFEDTFGYLSRRFVNQGARAIVNLSNDAWSRSLTCQYQHLSMSVFRAVENRVPLARSTASGQTAIVDPYGRIVAMAAPFTETALVGRIPVIETARRTPYRAWGDLWGVLFAASGSLALGVGLLTKLKNMYDN